MGTRTGQAKSDDRDVSPRSAVLDYCETLLVAVIFVLFVRSFVVQQSEIPSGSMEDTVLVGDYVLVNRMLYAATTFDWERRILPRRDVRRGEIVVFKHPDEPEQDFIKRVIGLPGERVELRDRRVHVDGRQLDEPYLNPLYLPHEDFGPIVVPPGQYFLLGDHRNRSADSRSWGTVGAELIKGRAILTLFSSASPPTADGSGRVTPESIARKIYSLAFRSRWDRCLRPLR